MKTARIPGLIFFLSILSICSCSSGPERINYGNDACYYCQMTIVDKIYGAEIITDKGKVFKFDAIECLIRYQNELESTEGYLMLTNHFETPEAFVPMAEATFLISENLPSPMGAYLTAFKTNESALEVKKEKGGELFNWEELQKQFEE